MNSIYNIISVIVLIGLSFHYSGCIDKVEFDHVDDPESKYYLRGDGVDCDSLNHERISISSAQIKWIWSDSAKKYLNTNVVVNIYRYQSDQLDTVYNIPYSQIDSNITVCASGSDTLTVWGWTDTNLVIETEYNFVIKVSNSAGEAKDSIKTLLYNHVFNQTDTNSISIAQVYSDTSVYCNWENTSEDINNIRKIKWSYESDGTLLAEIVIDSVGVGELINRDVKLDSTTSFEFYFGYDFGDTTIWQRKPAHKTYTMQFDPVNNLLAVPFQKGLNRITWRYDLTKVRPDRFTVSLGSDSIGFVDNDSLLYSQKILGPRYIVFYDNVVDNTIDCNYTIIPKTNNNSGKPSSVACKPYPGILSRLNLNTEFTFVDSLYDSTYFFISNYEMSLREFVDVFNSAGLNASYFSDNCFNYHNFIDASNNTLSIDSTSMENHPIDFLTWDIADIIVKSIDSNFSLPTVDEWKLSARASSNDGRQFAWGDDPPDNNINCNFNSNGTMPVKSLTPGRVNVSWRNQIRGPYHMCGNVKEWTRTPFPSRADAYKTKGGAWFDYNISSVLINNDIGFPKTEQIGGIRLVWKE